MVLRDQWTIRDHDGALMRPLFAALILFIHLPDTGRAEGGTLFFGGGMGAARGGLIPVRSDLVAPRGASLFVGRAETGLFADPPEPEPAYADAPITALRGTDVERIRALIGAAESRRDGYDAVQHGARVKPGRRPTQMTLAEIYQWIDDTPGQPHAIGRYQFIPQTLRRVAAKIGAQPHQVFSPRLQDQLADVLLAEAGWHRFRAGELGQTAFMNNLAKIWAGLPTSAGKSYYDGYAGNKAAITWARFEAEMTRIAPG
jgi:muramidase (phage lysozyme)